MCRRLSPAFSGDAGATAYVAKASGYRSAVGRGYRTGRRAAKGSSHALGVSKEGIFCLQTVTVPEQGATVEGLASISHATPLVGRSSTS